MYRLARNDISWREGFFYCSKLLAWRDVQRCICLTQPALAKGLLECSCCLAMILGKQQTFRQPDFPLCIKVGVLSMWFTWHSRPCQIDLLGKNGECKKNLPWGGKSHADSHPLAQHLQSTKCLRVSRLESGLFQSLPHKLAVMESFSRRGQKYPPSQCRGACACPDLLCSP